MNDRSPLQFKIATEEWEIELIHRLNYKTFVEEIPQHARSQDGRLVDKFHEENTYLICLCERRLVGMLAARGQRPFSLDQKLPNLDSFLPPGRSLCEIRLLSVEKEFRTGQVFQGLLALLWQFFLQEGYDMGIISGTTRQQKLYRHIGFSPFGPLVGKEGAFFQPMFLALETFEQNAREFFRAPKTPVPRRPMVNFLPGPVAVHPDVTEAFEQPPQSHRSASFIREFQATKQLLTHLAGSKKVEIFLGSGTLANDAIAAQLSLQNSPGIILSNGEFGDRLIDHARRFGLKFAEVRVNWGEPLLVSRVSEVLDAHPATGWIWAVHCETSTGVMNDLSGLKTLAHTRDLKLCLDCISSIGTVPFSLEGVYLASGVSGKGLAAYPGLALVFYNHSISAASAPLPRYLDLALYANIEGTPFTHSSNLLRALRIALSRKDWDKRLEELKETSIWLRTRLQELKFKLIGTDSEPAPGAVTIELPYDLNSAAIGAQLEENGYLLSYGSEYLRHRNWVQICLMGEFSRDTLVALLALLHQLCSPPLPKPKAPEGPSLRRQTAEVPGR